MAYIKSSLLWEGILLIFLSWNTSEQIILKSRPSYKQTNKKYECQCNQLKNKIFRNVTNICSPAILMHYAKTEKLKRRRKKYKTKPFNLQKRNWYSVALTGMWRRCINAIDTDIHLFIVNVERKPKCSTIWKEKRESKKEGIRWYLPLMRHLRKKGGK